MSNQIDLQEIMNHFACDVKLNRYGNGHINDTYLTEENDYILQRINTNVFKNPDEVMENIERVTSYLRDKITAEGGNPDRETLTVIKTTDGKNLYKHDDNNVYRMYKFVADTISVEDNATLKELESAGKGFGKFGRLLDDFDADSLYETIVNFHNTPSRVEALKEAITNDVAGRCVSVKEEIDFALKCAEFADTVVKGMENGTIPSRVTHNDTKINNILFDGETKEALCVIDLDTVMPGSALYDFGDALRIGASTAAEDETDLSKVNFDCEKFKAFAKGYLSEMKDILTADEIKLLPFSAKLLTFECGTRFLTDYLNGDTYFKIHREHHNLDRARNQFKLVRDIIEKEQELNKIIENI